MKTISRAYDKEIEERIEMEIIVDAYDESEQMMGWYYYLHDTITFPFNAKIMARVASSPFSLGDQATVTGMAAADDCEHDMMLLTQWNKKPLAIPLKQIEAINADNATHQAVNDWHYWLQR